jgi:hypothetical protein
MLEKICGNKSPVALGSADIHEAKRIPLGVDSGNCFQQRLERYQPQSPAEGSMLIVSREQWLV